MAIYFPDSNVLYVHFPKTGGCSFYDVINSSSIRSENKGFQHDTVDMLDKWAFLTKPQVVVFSREKESWFESYHRWRRKNPTEFELPGVNEHWHPKWVLEELYNYHYDKFRKNVDEKYPDYYEDLCRRYYKHPTFNVTIYPFEEFEDSYNKLFKRIGLDISFDNYPVINATRVFP